MTFGVSLELFALVWALLCGAASAVVIDTLLKALPQPPQPGDANRLAAPRPWPDGSGGLRGPGLDRPCFRDRMASVQGDGAPLTPAADAA